MDKELSDRTQEKKGTTLGHLLTISNHPPRENQDASCPHIEWMGEDLVHCPEIGEWKCMLQVYTYGDLLHGGGSENTDYRPCNHPNHERCSLYLNKYFGYLEPEKKPAIPTQRSQLEFQFQ